MVVGPSLLLVSCERGTQPPHPPEIDGSWEWVQSVGGGLGQTVTPATARQTELLVIKPGGHYLELSTPGGSYEGSYTVSRGVTFDQPRDSVRLIRFERPLFGRYFVQSGELAARIRGDTLELVQTGSHAWSHHFVRSSQRQ
jgi:hypothetical protein